MDMHSCGAARLLIAGLLCAAPATAQFPQYTAPGSLAIPQTPTQERVETGAEEARWNFGALRVDPRFWLHNMGYNDNVFGAPDGMPKVSDVSASVGAGLVAFSRFGSDVMISAYILPEYNWWADQDQLREENFNFGAALFGFYNRLTLVLEARRDERQRFLSSESLVPYDIRETRAGIQAATELAGRFELFGSLEAREYEHSGAAAEQTGVDLVTLDREESIARLGVAYRFPSELRIGIGAEYSEADFPVDPAGRSNTTFGPLLEIDYDTGRVDLTATAVLRKVDFDAARSDSRSELTGSIHAGWQPGHRLRFDAYGGRTIVYSVVRADRFFSEERVGLAVGTPWGRRLHVRGFGETGTDDYDRVNELAAPREDDVTSFGGEVDFEINRRLQFSVVVVQTDFDSNAPGFDRSVTVFRAGLEVGGDSSPW